MSANVYNIIWADDECDTLKKDTSIRRLFNDNKIEVLSHVATSEDLKDAIERYKDRIDAIIVDGNFTKEKVAYVEPTDISGLIHTISFIELFNSKRDIPFFLYTGRKVMLQEICKNGELDYFLTNSRIIQKGNIRELADKIIKDVDHIHSIEFMVKKKYADIIKIATSLDKSIGENLHQFLLDEARDTKFNKSIDLFNQLRLIMERIMELCKKDDIIPQDIHSLNNFRDFFTFIPRFNKTTKKDESDWYGFKKGYQIIYKPNMDLMPKSIGVSFKHLIDILQDGSHKIQDLNLQVSEYVQEANTPFLFRSCLYQVLDIIRWYGNTKEKILNGDFEGHKLYYISQ